ncbi:MAG: WYL domain-containing protein [Treponema sp.]|nr:WYL domain-containing protein [Treponema sp.]
MAKSFNLTERQVLILKTVTDETASERMSAARVAKKIGYSVTTVGREIAILEDLGILEYTHQRYSLTEDFKNEKFYSDTTKNNLALVAAIKGLLVQYKDTPLYDKVEKLIYQLEPVVVAGSGILNSRITVAPQMKFIVNNQNWNKVFKAIQNNQKLCFNYDAPKKNSKAKRIIYPYQMLLDDGSVYVFGHSEYQNLDLLYLLNSMKNIVVMDETFSLPEDFDFASRCGGGRLGAFRGWKVENFKIEFYGYGRTWIKNHDIAEDQTIIEDSDKEDKTVVTFSSSQRNKILNQILGFGRNACPLAPETLVTDWKNEIRAISRML